ncbi:hypothetical protein ACFW1A_24240 [Kitasatospora sp. NPDC058965]|uniref:hypothetical protein n=1 Tax=Kitasatospora sp. NPDC058965 TaxID=3346682 RepID=UPI0036A34E65
MYDEVLLAINGDKAAPVDRVGLPDLELQERAHLQEWLLANPEILGPGVEIITSEYDRWQTASGDPVLDRLDLLALSPDGHLIVAELKRGAAPHSIHMQAINYAAMVSRLTPEDIAELYAATLRRRGQEMETESALTRLTSEFLLSSETIRRPRIALVASDFPPSVTASVVWLNEQQVDISLIRFRPYQLPDGQLVVSFSKIFPVPDVEEFTVGRRVEVPASVSEPGAPWDEESLRRLAERGNPATLSILDLCSAEDPGRVGVSQISQHAGITVGAVRGRLAGLTMRLNNPKNGFAQNEWPVWVEWLPGGVASYQMDPAIAEIWRAVRQQAQAPGEEQD